MRPKTRPRLNAAVVVILVVAGIGGLVGLGFLGSWLGGTNRGGSGFSYCAPMLGTWPGTGSQVGQQDAAILGEESKQIVALIISIGKQRQLAPRAWQVAIQAGKTESGLRNLNYGDRDSLGIFQMRPSMGWGSVQEVTDPVYAINKFYDVLLNIKNWEKMRPGDAAQAVERSAFPDRYHRWESMAVFLITEIGQLVDYLKCDSGPEPSGLVRAAIEFALAQLGKEYEWGAEGPWEFDCSGLMQAAYLAAGIEIPRVSRDQWKAGAYLPVQEALPGDLVFWAYDPSDPATIHHVAMYLGNGEIVEAPYEGMNIRRRPLKWDEGELVDFAVRPATVRTAASANAAGG